MKQRICGGAPGQAMLETVLAVLFVSFVFVTLFRLSHMLTGKILLEHAAMRVARARAVGYNAFMCKKAARICMLPISGERLQPGKDDTRTGISEAAMAREYLESPNATYADALLNYEKWEDLEVIPGTGGASKTALRTEWFDLTGEAEVDGFPVYLNDQGL